MPQIRYFEHLALAPAALAHTSQRWLDDAEPALALALVRGDAILRGAFERHAPSQLAAFRRGSGGRSVRAASGCMYFALSIPRPDWLQADVRASNLLNRLLRPLLRALSFAAGPAHYFGRDWIAVAKRPAATVAFAHERASGRTLIEAFIGVGSSVAHNPHHPSYLGKAPASLHELLGQPLDAEALLLRVRDAFCDAYRLERCDAPWPEGEATALAPEPPWQHTIDEPIGLIGARRDAFGAIALGGEWMISRDALAALTAWLSSAQDDAELDEALATCLSGDDVALFGVRDLHTIKQLLLQLPPP